MKRVIGPVIGALVLLVLAFVSWIAGEAQLRAADAQQQLMTLQYGNADAAIAKAIEDAQRFPWLTAEMQADLRRRRAAALYWQGKYRELALERDASGATIEKDPEVLFASANAAYRANQAGRTRPMDVRQLDAALKNYGEVLKANPDYADAAFNYEYIARLKSPPSAARAGAKVDPRVAARGGSSDVQAPTGPPTVHGRPGAPPLEGLGMEDIKTIMPMRPEERDAMPDPGMGKQPLRKG